MRSRSARAKSASGSRSGPTAPACSLVLRRALGLATCGIVVGLAGAAGLTRFISSQLWQVTPTDPLTFAVVTGVMLAVTLVACLIPTTRVLRVDPTIALRP